MLIIAAMHTVNDLFEQFGGTGAVARIMKVGHSTASEMRRRGSIPLKYWSSIIDHAKSINRPEVDNDLLVRIHVPDEERAA